MNKVWTKEQEIEQLQARFDVLKANGGSQAEFARDHSFPGGASMITQHLKGHRPINLQHAVVYANGFGCALEDISPRLAKLVSDGNATTAGPFSRNGNPVQTVELEDNPEYPAIRRVAFKAQAGVTGYAVEYLNDDGPPIVFGARYFKAEGLSPEKLLASKVAGESMIPTLYPGDLIVVNTGQTQPREGVAYLVNYEGEIVVKRMMRDEGKWWLTSDNADQRRYPRKVCNEHTEVIGEVIYKQSNRI